MNNRAGEFKTNLTGELRYQSFLPRPLPPSPPIELDDDCVKLLSKANRSIGILEGFSRQVASVELFVSMYVRKEALLSSQIEGTRRQHLMIFLIPTLRKTPIKMLQMSSTILRPLNMLQPGSRSCRYAIGYSRKFMRF